MLLTRMAALFVLASSLLASHQIIAQDETQKTTHSFLVFLDDREMGTHEVVVSTEGDQQQVSIEADFEVKILFYTAFEYQHRVDETWEQGCLKSIKAKTNNNGEDLFLDGAAKGEKFVLKSHAGTQTFGSCVRSFAYWDLDLLKSDALLNMQTSEYEPSTLEFKGNETLIMNERPYDAARYELIAGGKLVTLWYSPEKKWLALESITEDDYAVRYFAQEAFQ